MKKKPLAWCQGEVCKYDTDTDTGNNYYARDEAADDACQDMGKSSNARVARKETTDEAPDDEHWGWVVKPSGVKVPGADTPDEALDDEHWGRVAVLSHPDEAPEMSRGWVAKSSGVKVPGEDTPDEALDDEHWGRVAALSHPDEAPEMSQELRQDEI